MLLPIRVPINWGYAVFDAMGQYERVGDRQVPAEILVSFPGTGDQPSLRMTLTVREGIPICSELNLAANSSGEVRSRDLRLISLEDWIEPIVAACSERSAEVVTTPIPDREGIRTVQKARSGRPRSVTDTRLDRAADLYRDHIEDRPVQAVAVAFGVSDRTAARYIEKCRETGRLPKTTPGKKQA